MSFLLHIVVCKPKIDSNSALTRLVFFHRFVDEEEIVISLKKHDKELVWPGLLENWETLTEGVSGLLKGVPVYIVGESSDINWAVAKKLAEGLEYILHALFYVLPCCCL